MAASRVSATIEPFKGQNELLKEVSRTFALTIPELPSGLRIVVNNAYLLCRIADTIEDESALDNQQKSHFHTAFLSLLDDGSQAHEFASALVPLLVNDATHAECELIRRTPDIVTQMMQFSSVERRALFQCLESMCYGMSAFDRKASLAGLATQKDMDSYCYYVAGVVGEMLTTLFCEHLKLDDKVCAKMQSLDTSFGQGLQMVNILKDFWEDRERGVCWLPRDLFAHMGISLEDVTPGNVGSLFARAYQHLIGTAHAHLLRGLEYTLLIPASASGIRRFCLLALVLAVKTLQRIARYPTFTHGQDVKVSRRVVASTLLRTRLWAGNDRLLRRWFRRMGKHLPLDDKIYHRLPA